jgi:hypothetical protein
MEGLNLPLVNRDWCSILAYGLFGSGSDGVPSTLTHEPIIEFQPIMLCKTHEWFCMTELPRTIDSLMRTPGPIVTPGPIDTFGPKTAVGSTVAVGWMVTFPIILGIPSPFLANFFG